jgi:hypothetical protein
MSSPRGEARREDAPAGDDGDGGARGEGPDRERGARGPEGQIGGRARARQGDEQRPIGEEVAAPAGARHRGFERPGWRGGLGHRPLHVALGGLVRERPLGGRGQHERHHPLLHARQLGPPRRGRRVHRVIDAQGRERGRDHVGVRRPVGGRLGHHRPHEPLQRLGDVGPELAERRRILEGRLEHDRERVVAGEGRLPGQALPEDAPEREEVDAGVDVARAVGLLGRHVAGGAERRARGGELSAQVGDAGDPEIEDGHPRDLAPGQEEVGGLEIAMNDAESVDRGERPRHPRAELEDVGDGELAAVDPVGERLALEPLGDQIGLPRRDAVRDVPHDAGERERGQDLRLPLEARLADDVAEELDRDQRPVRVAGAVHVAHAPGAGQALDGEPPVDRVVRTHRRRHGRRAGGRGQGEAGHLLAAAGATNSGPIPPRILVMVPSRSVRRWQLPARPVGHRR